MKAEGDPMVTEDWRLVEGSMLTHVYADHTYPKFVRSWCGLPAPEQGGQWSDGANRAFFPPFSEVTCRRCLELETQLGRGVAAKDARRQLRDRFGGEP